MIGTYASAVISNGSPCVSSSWVSGTAPSTELSSATQAASAVTGPNGTQRRRHAADRHQLDRAGGASRSTRDRAACSVKVPSGPR